MALDDITLSAALREIEDHLLRSELGLNIAEGLDPATSGPGNKTGGIRRGQANTQALVFIHSPSGLNTNDLRDQDRAMLADIVEVIMWVRLPPSNQRDARDHILFLEEQVRAYLTDPTWTRRFDLRYTRTPSRGVTPQAKEHYRIVQQYTATRIGRLGG